MGPGTLQEVQDRSWNRSVGPFGGEGLVRGPSRRSGTGRGTLSEVRDGSRDHLEGPGRIVEPSWMSGTGWGTLQEVWNG